MADLPGSQPQSSGCPFHSNDERGESKGTIQTRFLRISNADTKINSAVTYGKANALGFADEQLRISSIVSVMFSLAPRGLRSTGHTTDFLS
jgi:hypothetical protein